MALADDGIMLAAKHKTWQESEPAEDEKWVAQQFIWSHPNLDYRRVLEGENHEPATRLSDETL